VSAVGVVAGIASGLGARHVHVGLLVMLDLWTAASLLRVSVDGSWKSIGAAATLVALRKVVGTVLGRASRPRATR
jgi:hypothetical protein